MTFRSNPGRSDSAFMAAGFRPNEDWTDGLFAGDRVRVTLTRVWTSFGPTPTNVFEIEIMTPQGLVELTVPGEWVRVRSWPHVQSDDAAWCAQLECDDTVADLERQFDTNDGAA